MRRSGFTLLEISIALVIIGLIVGGVLVAKNLIRAAEIRQTIAQYKDFEIATQAFRIKFGCLPGDCTNVVEKGLNPATEGNGDALIGQCAQVSNPFEICSGGNPPPQNDIARLEPLNYWYHLSASQLIKERFEPVTSIPASIVPFLWPLGTGMTPKTKLPTPREYLSFGGWGIAGDILFDATLGGEQLYRHGFIMSTVMMTNMGGGQDGASTAPGGWSGNILHAIDTKLDDAMPQSGNVRAYKGLINQGATPKRFMLNFGAGPSSYHCLDTSTSPYRYNLQYEGIDFNGLCSLIILAEF